MADSVGFRTVETRGSDIVVNGEVSRLKGISMHAEGPTGGTGLGAEDAATLFDWAEELGANFVRLAHYHTTSDGRRGRQAGVLAWVELPVYWGIEWSNEATLTNTLEQTNELVLRDRCRPSVVLWSVANETFPGDERTAFIGSLIERVRSLDPTRLVTCALFTLPGQGIETHIEDPLGELIDVIGGTSTTAGTTASVPTSPRSAGHRSGGNRSSSANSGPAQSTAITAMTARSGPRSSRLPSTNSRSR